MSMNRGVLARVDGSLGRLGSFARIRREEGEELKELVDVESVKRTPDGLDITSGRAANQELRETESVSLANNEISVSATSEITTNHTEFLTAGDEFAAVKSGDGTFAFDLLGDELGAELTRADIDLDSFWLSLDDATPWKVGFYGNDGPVENGVVHGESVLDDGVFGTAIADLKKNQLGARVNVDGQEYKFVITKSGYLELYQPREVDAATFAEFVVDHVAAHTS
jgi:hypothetical protein